MTTTLRMGRFAAEAAVPPEAAETAAAWCEALPDLAAAARKDPVTATAYWVACAALHHADTTEAGRDRVTEAFAAGLELALRVRGSLDGRVAGGWDPVCAAVLVGAAAATARSDGLDGETVTRALGIAATQASGLAVLAPSPLGTFQRGRAALNGRQAAALARAGMTAPATGLEGRRGLYALLAPGTDAAPAADGLGDRWLVAELGAPPGTSGPPGTAGGRADAWTGALRHATEVLT
ncbi:MmgE/PrpD family protein [Actinomadura viridis]|uniref:MmgE/PrpD family protein n=1 Tax=Actinomadura viridis TaxID=58110 RepID=UPI00369BFC19